MSAPPPTADVCLTHDIYDPEAVTQAIDEYRDHLTIRVAAQDATKSTLRFSISDSTPPDEVLVREFLNYVLDLSVRAKLGAA